MDAPASIHSASLHPDKDFFVAGGDDFKLYKYDYATKEEMGRNLKENVNESQLMFSINLITK